MPDKRSINQYIDFYEVSNFKKHPTSKNVKHLYNALIFFTSAAIVYLKPNVTLFKNHSPCAVCKAHRSGVAPTHAGFSDQFKEFFIKLFNTDSWPPRWHCGTWTDFHGWLYIVSDLMIWAAYFVIPLLLFTIVIKRKDIPFPKIFWLFIAFILLCGLTHFLDAAIFWWPAYRLSALIRFAAGLVSIFTVYALYKILPLVNNLRTLDQLESEIEERKKAEQEAKHQQLLQQATIELMQKKDEFMSIASHELKTPITSVKASLQVVERLVSKNEALKPVSPFVEKAAKQVNKLTDIVNNLLDVTKIQAGKLELLKSQFVLADLVKECADHCLIDNSKHKVTVKGNTAITVFADRNRIEQVICNLLTNAVKYSPVNDEVMVSIEQLNTGYIKVMVTDQGIGIPEDKIDEVFDRFFRVEHTSQSFSGLGLGLYISSEIIKQHGGEIGVVSTLGKGSTFWFTV